MVARVSSAALTPWRTQAGRLNSGACNTASATVALEAFVRSIEDIASQCGQRSLGWLLGSSLDLQLLPEVGQAALTSSTLGAALRRLAAFFPLIQDASELSVSSEAGNCVIAYRILDPDIWPRHQDAIFTLAIVAQLIRKAAPERWHEVEAALEDPDPAASQELARLAGIGCCSGSDANVLRFPVCLLDRPLPSSVPGLTPPDLGQMTSRMTLKHHQTTVQERVRTAIYRMMGNGQVDQQHIARTLGMSGRTLRRRLSREGVSFQRIYDECRMRQAMHEFRTRGRGSIIQTALRLGYSEHSTFTRAFNRWSGMAPQTFMAGCI